MDKKALQKIFMQLLKQKKDNLINKQRKISFKKLVLQLKKAKKV
jgi:hypothetical protein